jgi:hypothetical protein
MTVTMLPTVAQAVAAAAVVVAVTM